MTSSPQRTWRALLLLLMTAFVAVPGCQPTADLASQAATEEGTWAYDARKNIWYEASFDAAAGDEVLHQGVLYRVGVDGSLVARGPADLASLEEASWFYEVAADDEDAPVEDDWVLALGGPDPGHVRLRDLTPGQGFAWHGRVYASRVSGQGELQIRPTGEVLSRVATTFKRHSPQLLEVALALDDGRTTTLSVTDGHPFYLPDEDTYRPVGKLAVGTALRTAGGGRAVLVGVERREGDFEVFNFEVEGLHNYYAGDAGVVVHNAKYGPKSGVRTAGEAFEDAVKNTFRGKIIRQNEVLRDSAGRVIGEIDFETGEAIVEVGLSLRGKLPQLHKLAEIAVARAKRLDVVYGPRTSIGTIRAFAESLGKKYGNRVRFIPHE